MGDRANIRLVDEEGEMYLYTHWSGTEFPAMLQAALRDGQPRWGDEPYLARFITTQVFKELGDSVTGGGLSTYLTDGGDRIITVDLVHSMVRVGNSAWSFSDFVRLEDVTWETLSHLS